MTRFYSVRSTAGIPTAEIARQLHEKRDCVHSVFTHTCSLHQLVLTVGVTLLFYLKVPNSSGLLLCSSQRIALTDNNISPNQIL